MRGNPDHENSDAEEVEGALNRRSVALRVFPGFVEVYGKDDNVVEDGYAIVYSDPVESSVGLVGASLSSSNDDHNNDEDDGKGASFRRSTRIRIPNVRFYDFEEELPERLVIQTMNAVLDPTSLKTALGTPD